MTKIYMYMYVKYYLEIFLRIKNIKNEFKNAERILQLKVKKNLRIYIFFLKTYISSL